MCSSSTKKLISPVEARKLMRLTDWTVTPDYPDTYSCAIINDAASTRLWLSPVPKHIEQLEIEWGGPLFKAEAIANVTHLFVQQLYPGCTYPPTLENLFIRDYDGEPIPNVINLFFHAHDIKSIEKADVGEHYLWYIEDKADSKLNTKKYRTTGKRITMDVFGCKYDVIKRVPKIDHEVTKEKLRIINEQIAVLQKEAGSLIHQAYDQISDDVLQQAHDQTRE